MTTGEKINVTKKKIEECRINQNVEGKNVG
jgi:hypothetical protein